MLIYFAYEIVAYTVIIHLHKNVKQKTAISLVNVKQLKDEVNPSLQYLFHYLTKAYVVNTQNNGLSMTPFFS